MNNIKKNDEVKVIAGKDKGKTGKVLQVLHNERVIVEKINMVKRHTRPSRTFQGGIIEKPAPIASSKIMLVCPQCGAATRVDKSKRVDGKNVRSCKKCNEIIDKA